jgi:1-deoxy-D-xylulose-5-phosphate reductoisomerase
MKKIAIVGSTGSIGQNALRVIEAAPDRFRIVGLAAGGNWERLADQIGEHRPALASVCSSEHAARTCALIKDDGPEVTSGEEGLCRVAAMPEADLVLIAVSGAAALAPAVAAIEAGKTVALANKECLVMAGELLLKLARERGATILPVDSEHAGVFQVLAGRPITDVRRIILPASGGPFLDSSATELACVTPEQAVAHPTWSMGKKISVDSATLMNKALEIIEARWLFGLAAERIDVVIHPESTVHALVEFIDGSVVAQLSAPDMRLPILHALAWPERIDLDLPRLDLPRLGRLSFRALDPQRFPAPALARRALQLGGTAPAVLAAADEAAVLAFLSRRLPFPRIVPLITEILDHHQPLPLTSIAAAMAADAWARAEVEKAL